MLVVAVSVKGREFLYNPKTAHKVPKSSAQKICDICNSCKFMIKNPDIETWFIHEIDTYSSAYTYYLLQEFKIRNGSVKEYAY